MSPAQVQEIVAKLFVGLERHYAGRPRLLAILEWTHLAADELVPVLAGFLPEEAAPRTVVDGLFVLLEKVATGNFFLVMGLHLAQRAVDVLIDRIIPATPAPVPVS